MVSGVDAEFGRNLQTSWRVLEFRSPKLALNEKAKCGSWNKPWKGQPPKCPGEGSAATVQGITLTLQTPTFCPAPFTVQQRRTEATTTSSPPTPPKNTTSYHPAMAEEKQPPGLVEGATGEVEEEVQDKAKSAEDRKAAAALSKLDARDDDVAGASVDQEGLNKAMNKLSVSKATENKDLKKVKVDAADVTLLVSLGPSKKKPALGTRDID